MEGLAAIYGAFVPEGGPGVAANGRGGGLSAASKAGSWEMK